MIDAVPSILARIVASKREELSRLPARPAARALRPARTRDFRAALTRNSPAIIAEIKKASPSKGVLQADFDPVRQAKQYASGGAAALSVLTDEPFFQGSLSHLEAARAAVPLPVLRKDFTIDPRHIEQAAASGADAVLLIAAILDERELRDLREFAATFGMAALTEVHNRRELETAVAAGADIIGVNNRDLTTFQVTLVTSLRLAEHLPDSITRVSESGIHSAADVRRLRTAGYHAFLVGEHLMKSADPTAALAALCS